MYIIANKKSIIELKNRLGGDTVQMADTISYYFADYDDRKDLEAIEIQSVTDIDFFVETIATILSSQVYLILDHRTETIDTLISNGVPENRCEILNSALISNGVPANRCEILNSDDGAPIPPACHNLYGSKIIIGKHDVTTRNAAGVLPILYFNSKLYAMLGLDKKICQYSDFGGSFDKRYVKSHKNGENFKTNILGDYQIKDGSVDPIILADHIANAGSDFVVDSKSVGYGDINTLYTAFRELMEETTSMTDKRFFSLETLYRKLYVDKQYIFLGGDPSYGYDTYVVFLSIDDFDESSKLDILGQIKQIEKIESTESYIDKIANTNCTPKKSKYAKGKFLTLLKPKSAEVATSGLDRSGLNKTGLNKTGLNKTGLNKTGLSKSKPKRYCIIEGNTEMEKIDLFPLEDLIGLMEDVSYDSYTEIIKSSLKKKTVHRDNFGAPIYDKLRSSFADALVRYNAVLSNMVDGLEIMKGELIQTNLCRLFGLKIE